MHSGMGKRHMDGMGRMGAEDYSVEFTPPDGLKLEGDSGRAMVSWVRHPDGKICIKTFDGVKLSEPTEAEPDEDDSEPDWENSDRMPA